MQLPPPPSKGKQVSIPAHGLLLFLQAKTEGGKIIRVEAHPIPEHPRPHRCKGRVALVGDAAGYVTKCSGEGIYFAAKSGRMAAEAIVEGSQQVSNLFLTRPLQYLRRNATACGCSVHLRLIHCCMQCCWLTLPSHDSAAIDASTLAVWCMDK